MALTNESGAPIALLMGNMVYAVQALEHKCYDVCHYLSVEKPDQYSISKAIKLAREEVALGLPPWTKLQETTVTDWFTSVSKVFDARNQFIHWRTRRVKTETEWVPQRVSPRDPSKVVESADREELPALHEQAHKLLGVGVELVKGLNFEVRAGVYMSHPHFARDGLWVPTVYWDEETQAWPAERPTQQEVDDWYDNLVATAPREWAAWPQRRLKNAAERQAMKG